MDIATKPTWADVDDIDKQIRLKQKQFQDLASSDTNKQWERGDVDPQLCVLASQIRDLFQKRKRLVSALTTPVPVKKQ